MSLSALSDYSVLGLFLLREWVVCTLYSQVVYTLYSQARNKMSSNTGVTSSASSERQDRRSANITSSTGRTGVSELSSYWARLATNGTNPRLFYSSPSQNVLKSDMKSLELFPFRSFHEIVNLRS